MATVIWEGGAAAVAKLITVTVGGTVEVGDVFKITMGNSVLTHVAASAVLATVADAIATDFAAMTAPEFLEVTAAGQADGTLTLTANTAGRDFSVVLLTTETGGGAADDQTFTQADTVANAGPNDYSTPANYSTGAVPVNADDLVIADSAVSILYGLAQSAVTLASLTIDQSFTGTIGLPRTNSDGSTSYVEYRGRYLAVGATAVNIGRGEGIGSGRMLLDAGSVQTTLYVYNTGDALDESLGALVWKGTHAANVVQVTKGTVSIAPFDGETAVIVTLREGYLSNISNDAWVECGDGLTLTTIDKSGGKLFIEDNSTTVTQTGGELTVRGVATVATLYAYGGTVFYESSGTATNVHAGGKATLDYRHDMRARTVSNISIHAGATILDPAGTVTWTNGLDLERCGIEDVRLELGTHFTIT